MQAAKAQLNQTNVEIEKETSKKIEEAKSEATTKHLALREQGL